MLCLSVHSESLEVNMDRGAGVLSAFKVAETEPSSNLVESQLLLAIGAPLLIAPHTAHWLDHGT